MLPLELKLLATDWGRVYMDLQLWDHCITAGPDLLYHFIAAYFISLRSQLLALDTDHKLATWLAGPPGVDVDQVGSCRTTTCRTRSVRSHAAPRCRCYAMGPCHR